MDFLMCLPAELQEYVGKTDLKTKRMLRLVSPQMCTLLPVKTFFRDFVNKTLLSHLPSNYVNNEEGLTLRGMRFSYVHAASDDIVQVICTSVPKGPLRDPWTQIVMIAELPPDVASPPDVLQIMLDECHQFGKRAFTLDSHTRQVHVIETMHELPNACLRIHVVRGPSHERLCTHDVWFVPHEAIDSLRTWCNTLSPNGHHILERCLQFEDD